MELTEIQKAAGAIFDGAGVLLGFDRDDEALAAIENGVAIVDRSHWGLLKISGADRLRYLHNQSTNDFEKRSPGQGCDTVFVTSTARTLDLATAYVMEDAVFVLVSSQRRQQLMSWLDRFIFPFDKVELTDISDNYAVFSLLGAAATNLLTKLIGKELSLTQLAEHQTIMIDDISVIVARGSGLATPGYTLIVEGQHGSKIWSQLTASDAVPFGDRLWENLRIQQGRPTPNRELTEDYNPLEAGLWQTVSFEKGCYIGQETIARLNTYNGVKQKLWGIELDRAIEPPTPITLADKKIGVLTSYTERESTGFGLGYVRTKAGGPGLEVKVGEASGKLVAVPFINHDR
ncbi:MAG: folate-binding protein [Cyanobacteria bacterium J06623_7]